MLAFRQISRVARPVARRMASVSSTSTSRVAPRFAAFLATSGLIIAAGAASEVDFPCNNISFCLADGKKIGIDVAAEHKHEHEESKGY